MVLLFTRIKIKEMSTVGFRMGEGFAKMLLNIARDHITSLEVEKGVEVFTKGLGTTRDVAWDIISGKKTLWDDVDNQQVYLTGVEYDDWGVKDGRNTLLYKKKDMVECAIQYHMNMIRYLKDMDNNTNLDNEITKTVSMTMEEYISGEINIGPHVKELLEDAVAMESQLEKLCIALNLLDIDKQIGTFEIDKGYQNYKVKWALHDIYALRSELLIAVDIFNHPNHTRIHEYLYLGEADDTDRITKYVNDRLKLEERDLGDQVDVLQEKYDAYWIDREGNVYAGNGEVALQLHQNMAEEIVASKKMGKEQDAQYTLEQAGYVKMTKDWVLYCIQLPEVNSDTGEPIIYKQTIPPSKAQMDIICSIITKWYHGKLTVGFKRTELTVGQFKQLKDFEIRKLFAY
jgi:hypothetical protein